MEGEGERMVSLTAFWSFVIKGWRSSKSKGGCFHCVYVLFCFVLFLQWEIIYADDLEDSLEKSMMQGCGLPL